MEKKERHHAPLRNVVGRGAAIVCEATEGCVPLVSLVCGRALT